MKEGAFVPRVLESGVTGDRRGEGVRGPREARLEGQSRASPEDDMGPVYTHPTPIPRAGSAGRLPRSSAFVLLHLLQAGVSSKSFFDLSIYTASCRGAGRS